MQSEDFDCSAKPSRSVQRPPAPLRYLLKRDGCRDAFPVYPEDPEEFDVAYANGRGKGLNGRLIS